MYSIHYMACSFQQSCLNLINQAKPNAWTIFYDHYLIVVLCYEFNEYISSRTVLVFFSTKLKGGAHLVLSLSSALCPALKLVSSSASTSHRLRCQVVLRRLSSYAFLLHSALIFSRVKNSKTTSDNSKEKLLLFNKTFQQRHFKFLLQKIVVLSYGKGLNFIPLIQG